MIKLTGKETKMNLRSTLSIALASASLLSFTQPANSLDILFGGNILSSCVLVVGAPGVFGVNANGDVLSSKEAGGSAGTLTATATGTGYEISITSPAAFTVSPAGATSDATFVSTYSLSGDTIVGETDEATSSPVNTGITNVSVDLVATKNSGIYSAGNYQAPVTVTCE